LFGIKDDIYINKIINPPKNARIRIYISHWLFNIQKLIILVKIETLKIEITIIIGWFDKIINIETSIEYILIIQILV